MAPTRILRDRVAGQSAMSEVVTAQQFARPQSAVGRLFGISPLVLPARGSYRAALGELLVGDLLENLGQRWDVLHDLPLEHHSLDHLVIGPAGVFTVRTANCAGLDVVVDGDAMIVVGVARDDIPLARAEAEQVSRILGDAVGTTVEVRPLLVVVRARRVSVKTLAEGVEIVSSTQLERLLTTAPRVLDGDQVALISDVADVESSWPVPVATVLDTQKLHRDFGIIRGQVGRALVRRIAWAAAATTAVYLSVCAVIATLVSIMMN